MTHERVRAGDGKQNCSLSLSVSFFPLSDRPWCLISFGKLYTGCRLPLLWYGPALAGVSQEVAGAGYPAELRFAPYQTGIPWPAVLTVKFGSETTRHFHVLRYVFGMLDGSIAGPVLPAHYRWSSLGVLLWRPLFLPLHLPVALLTDIFSPAQCWNVLQGPCLLNHWQDSK